MNGSGGILSSGICLAVSGAPPSRSSQPRKKLSQQAVLRKNVTAEINSYSQNKMVEESARMNGSGGILSSGICFTVSGAPPGRSSQPRKKLSQQAAKASQRSRPMLRESELRRMRVKTATNSSRMSTHPGSSRNNSRSCQWIVHLLWDLLCYFFNMGQKKLQSPREFCTWSVGRNCNRKNWRLEKGMSRS